MKKTFLLIAVAMLSTALFSQDLASIVKKYEKASGTEKLKSFNTILMEGAIEQMGMSLNMVVKEKNPDKLKTVMTYSGVEMTTVVNGNRGYMINPMMGSSEPVALPEDQIAQVKNNRNLGSSISTRFNEGKLEFLGEETFRGTDCFKLKMQTEAGDVSVFLSKETNLIKGMRMVTSQMGQEMDVEAVMSNYKEFEGVKMAMKVDTYVSGTFGYAVTFTKIEFNVPIDDSEFEIK